MRGERDWSCGGVEQCVEDRGGNLGPGCARGCACAGDVLWVCSDDPHIAASARVGELQGISWAMVLKWHEEQQQRQHQGQRGLGEDLNKACGEELKKCDTASVTQQQQSGRNMSEAGSAARVGADARIAYGGEGNTAAGAGGAGPPAGQERETWRQSPLLSPDEAALLRGHAMLADWWLMRQADVLLASNRWEGQGARRAQHGVPGEERVLCLIQA